MAVHRKNFVRLIIYALILCALHSTALALILHPDGEPDVTWAEKPSDFVVGRWDWNACFVVIAPNWIVTTRHQTTTPSTVNIDSVDYKCNYSSQWTGGAAGNIDIQVIRLTTLDNKNPNLANYAEIYTDPNENGLPIVIGGHGNGRDAIIKPNERYEWDYASGNSSPLRWATNTVDGTDNTKYVSDVIISHFSTLSNNPNDYEGIVAVHDSGGGWFTKAVADWKLIGLTRAVEFHGDSLYSDAQSWVGDYQDAVRISSYASWITPIITCTGDMLGDINDDCIVNFDDLIVLASNWLRDDCDGSNDFCDGADTDPADGYVDFIDFARLAADWLNAD